MELECTYRNRRAHNGLSYCITIIEYAYCGLADA